MNVKHDNTTGLPEVPEGHWWEVRKFSRIDYFPYGYGSVEVDDGYKVCLMKKVTVPARVTRGHRWWELSKYTPEHVKDEVLFQKQITDPKRYRDWSSSSLSAPYSKVGKVFIEPADVLKTAKDIVDMVFEAADHASRKEISDGLVGVYPPKALEASE